MTSATRRRFALCAAIATIAALGGCATATGPQFTGLEPVPAGQAQVYLYRKSALYAIAAAYDVSHNGKPVGKLVNASYLMMPVAPGEHEFSVDERGFTTVKKFKINAETGRRYFVEYDSSKGLLLGFGLLSGSAAKSESEALADLKDLKRVQ